MIDKMTEYLTQKHINSMLRSSSESSKRSPPTEIMHYM